jgi:hypothetical protein
MDALEEARERQRLADEIADADSALRALGDDGPLEVLELSADKDQEEIEARSAGASEAETAIDKAADDLLDGGSASLPQREPEIYRPFERMGALPFDSKADSDMSEFGRTFLRAADRRAARKAARLAARR